MRGFESDLWQACKGEKEIVCRERERVQVKVSCTKPCCLFGLREGTWVPLEAGGSFKAKLSSEGWEKFKVTGPDKVTLFGLCVKVTPCVPEPVDPQMAPVIEPRAPDNLVQALKLQMMGGRGFTRRPDPDDMPSLYEVQENDFLFEEELVERARRASEPGDPNPEDFLEGPEDAAEEPPEPPARAAE